MFDADDDHDDTDDTDEKGGNIARSEHDLVLLTYPLLKDESKERFQPPHPTTEPVKGPPTQSQGARATHSGSTTTQCWDVPD